MPLSRDLRGLSSLRAPDPTHEPCAARVVSWARGMGSDATRDAVHEGWHGTSLGVADWDREEVHAAVMILPVHERVRQEICARAAEWLVCEALGIEYDPEKWAGLAAMEAIRSGVSMPYAAWLEGIRRARSSPKVLAYVAEVLAL